MFETFRSFSLEQRQAWFIQWVIMGSMLFLFIPDIGIWLMVGSNLLFMGGCSLFLAIKKRNFRNDLQDKRAIWCQFQDEANNLTLLFTTIEQKDDLLIIKDLAYTEYDIFIKMYETPFSLEDFIPEELFNSDLGIPFTIPTLSLYVEADPNPIHSNLLHCLGIVPKLKFPIKDSHPGEEINV